MLFFTARRGRKVEEKILPIEIDPELLRVYNEYEEAQTIYQKSFSDPEYKNKLIALIVTFCALILALILLFTADIFGYKILLLPVLIGCTSFGFVIYHLLKERNREAHFERMSHDKILNIKYKLGMMIVTFNEIIDLGRKFDVKVFKQRRENLLRLASQLKKAEESGENLEQAIEAIRHEFVFGQKMLIQSYLVR
ncbi:MAG: hypothetical protein WC663_03465 [Patescibacteria group bacterium]|jgi:hypothetical protein